MRDSYLTRRVWSHAALVLAENVLATGCQALLLYAMARHYGPARFGLVTLTFTLTAFGGVVASLGSTTYGVRALAARPEAANAVLSPLLGFQLLNAVVASVLLAGIAWGAADDTTGAWFALLLVASLPAMLCQSVVRVGFYGRERFAPITLLGSLQSLILLAASLPAIAWGAPLSLMGALIATVSWLSAGVALKLHAACFGPIRPGLTLAEYRRVGRESLPYFAVAVLAIVHMKVDVPLIRLLRGSVELGLYGVAAALVNAATVSIHAFTTALFPAVAREGGNARTLSPSMALRTLVVPLGLGLLAAAAIATAAGPAVRFFLGPAYAGSLQPLRILAWFLPCIFVSSTAIRMMMACGAWRIVIRILAVNSGVNIAANLVLIPWVGISGAATATVLSSAVSALQCVGVLRRWDSGLSGTGNRPGAEKPARPVPSAPELETPGDPRLLCRHERP